MRFIVSLCCIFFTTYASAQVDLIFRDLQPRTLKFDVSFNVRVRNDKGEVIAIRNIMNIPEHLKRLIDSCENKEELISILKKELNNGRYDWEANILLYYITEEDCLNMFPYVPDKVSLWLKKDKIYCMKFWNERK